LLLEKLVSQFRNIQSRPKKLIPVSFIIAIVIIITTPYLIGLPQLLKSSQIVGQEKELSYQFYAENLLGKDEGFLTTSIDSNQICYLESQRLPSTKAYAIVPWLTDVFEDEIIADLSATKTKIIFHNPDNAVWGNVLKNYAPKLNSFILNNYQEFDTKLRGIYIRKEFYAEAERRLMQINPNFFAIRYGLNAVKPEMPVGEILPGNTITQTFIAETDKLRSVSILMATYMRKNTSILKFTLLNENNDVVVHKSVDTSTLLDNQFYDFEFSSIEKSEAKRFSIQITAISGVPGASVTAWMSKSDIYPLGTLNVNGKPVEGDLSIQLSYNR
jgi:hypothetical protein